MKTTETVELPPNAGASPREDRTRDLEQRLAVAQRERDAAVEELSICLSRVAHDVAGPVRAFSALRELLQRDDPGRLTSTEARFLDEVSRSAGRTAQLLKYLSAYAQIPREPASMHRQIDLAGAVAAAEAEIRPQLEAAGGRIESAEMPAVRGHPARLQQLLGCLLSNSLKYRRPHAPLRIAIAARRELPGWWAISVADNGRGIEPKHCESVFALFQRYHGNEIPGTGMGLTLARRIVEAHGGRIWVEQSPAHGASLVFTLPAARA